MGWVIIVMFVMAIRTRRPADTSKGSWSPNFRPLMPQP